MAQIIDEQIPGMETPWENYRGSRVEEFIKKAFGTKTGTFHVTEEKDANGFHHLWGFATEADKAAYLEDQEGNAALRLCDVAIPIVEDQATTYAARLTLLDISAVEGGGEAVPLDLSAPVIAVDKSYKIGVRFSGIQNDSGVISDAGEVGTLTIQRSNDNFASTPTTVATMQLNSLPTDSTRYAEVDLGQWFTTTNPQQFRLRVSFTKKDDDGNEIATAQSAWQVISDVTYTQLTVQNLTDWKNPTDTALVNNTLTLNFAVQGQIKKWLHVIVSGSRGNYTGTFELDASTEPNAANPFVLQLYESTQLGILTHGVHTVTAWVTAGDGSGHVDSDGHPDGLVSETVVNRFMVVNTDLSGVNGDYTTAEDLQRPFLMLQQTKTDAQNYVRIVLTQYAVWVPSPTDPHVASETPLPVSIRITDEAENDTDYNTEYVRNELSVTSRTEYALDTTIEIEGTQEPSLHAYLRIFRYGENDDTINFMGESIPGLDFITIQVDNSQNFSPTVGATFVLSPRTRNNSETDKFTIINQQTGEPVNATFTRFGGINDLWTTAEDGQKVLRVLAGSELEIEWDPWAHFANNPGAALSFELDFAVHNITAEDEPVVDITQEVGGETLGMRMLPLEGVVKCVGRQATNDQDFKWEEDARTHLVLTINPSVIAKGDNELTWQRTWNDAPSRPLSLAKVYVDGVPSREVDYTPTAGAWVSGNGHTIKIGNPNADIDIYGMKTYNFALSAEQVRQNRKSGLPTAAEKVAFEERNAITTNGIIDYVKAKAKGYRCLKLVGIDQYKNNQLKAGYPCYWQIDHDNPNLSGTIGHAAYLAYMAGTLGDAACLLVTPQGSTANTYWDNNEQTKVDGITYRIIIPFSKVHSDFGWKAAKSTGEDCANPMYLDGNRIEGTDYASLTDEQKARVRIEVLDGWFDGHGWSANDGEMGMYHGQFYTSYVGGAKCTKLVNKINYASPMQSHKMGATRLYHDVMQAVTGGNSLTRAGARFAVYEESFLFFTEHPNDNGKVEFRGMCTFGNGKFDKAVFGYKADDRTFGFEGLNNNLPLCDFRVPADESVTYDPDDEAWGYNGTKSFEYGLGATQKINGEKYPTETNDMVFRKYVNFIYTHNTRINYTNGSRASFLAAYNALIEAATDRTQAKLAAANSAISAASLTAYSAAFLTAYNAFVEAIGTAGEDEKRQAAANAAEKQVSEMQLYQWWSAQNSPNSQDKYKLVRYDFATSGWVEAGRFDLSSETYYTAGERNLSTDSMTQAAYAAWDVSVNKTNAQLNEAFIAAVAQHAIDNFGLVARADNHLTHYNLVNFLMAGTDNCSKNTYYQYDPEDGLIWLDQDDLDSILPTDNNGRQTKVYFLDRIHDVADYEAGYKPQIDYEGRASALFNLIERAYESGSNNALRQNMRAVLDAMVGLVGTSDGYGDPSVMACLRKYFFSIQEYFPEVAYAEQARLRYEWPKSFGYTSQGNQARNIDPITQQVGRQLENERQYMKRRMVLIATYACWGNISGVGQSLLGINDVGASLALTPGSGNNAPTGYRFRLVPHQWIYPSGFVQRSPVDPHVRVAPGASNMPNGYFELVVGSGGIGGDDSAGLAALNYYRKIGNIGNFTVSPAGLTINAKRLTEFVAEPDPGSQGFAPSGIDFNTPNLRRLSMKGCASMVGSKDYSSLARVEEIDLIGTNITGIVLPVSQLIETLRLPATMTAVSLTAQPNLSTFSMEGFAALETLVVTGSPLVATQSIVMAIYEAQRENQVLTTLTIRDLQWENLPVDILSWMADLQRITVNGTIGIYEPYQYQSAVTMDIKKKLIRKFGNVDDEGGDGYRGLLLDYKMNQFNVTPIIQGNFYVESGSDFQFDVVPRPNTGSIYSNAFTKITWGLVKKNEGLQDGVDIDQEGVLRVTQPLSNTATTFKVTAAISTYDKDSDTYDLITISKDLEIYDRKPQLGDYVYHDGTFSSPDTYSGEKYVIGICCYLAPVDNNGDIVAELFHPEDKQKRLMVARANVSATGSQESGGLAYSTWQWGAYRNTGLSAADYALMCIHDLVPQEGNNLYHALKCPEANLDTSTFYDIPTIINIAGSTFYITDANMRDGSSTLGAQNHGFKPFPYNAHFGDGVTGGSVAGSDYFDGNISARTLSESLAELAGNGYSEGDIVNSGYAKTLKIIEHRNKILKNGVVMIPADPERGISENRLGPFVLPDASPGQTELQSLASLMGNLRKHMAKPVEEGGYAETNVAKWTQLYFPAASAAYAYQPSVPSNFVLADKFKAHNWFLPTEGLLDRIHWYLKKGADSELNIFKKALADGLFVNFSSYSYWSSTEIGAYYAWTVIFSGTYSSNGNKSSSNYCVRAVAAF